MTSTLPAGSRKCRGSRPTAAAHQRPSGRSHSNRTDPSTITSPTLTGSRTQIRPGIHGAQRQTTHHNHSPPPLTRARVQISSTHQRGPPGSSFSSRAGVSGSRAQTLARRAVPASGRAGRVTVWSVTLGRPRMPSGGRRATARFRRASRDGRVRWAVLAAATAVLRSSTSGSPGSCLACPRSRPPRPRPPRAPNGSLARRSLARGSWAGCCVEPRGRRSAGQRGFGGCGLRFEGGGELGA
jgi:hypothetical protein